MKDLKDAIYEASKKSLQFAKFENLPAKESKGAIRKFVKI